MEMTTHEDGEDDEDHEENEDDEDYADGDGYAVNKT